MSAAAPVYGKVKTPEETVIPGLIKAFPATSLYDPVSSTLDKFELIGSASFVDKLVVNLNLSTIIKPTVPIKSFRNFEHYLYYWHLWI